jgi:hypothetical protein
LRHGNTTVRRMASAESALMPQATVTEVCKRAVRRRKLGSVSASDVERADHDDTRAGDLGEHRVASVGEGIVDR